MAPKIWNKFPDLGSHAVSSVLQNGDSLNPRQSHDLGVSQVFMRTANPRIMRRQGAEHFPELSI